jgi:uncharacterized damage-inducible protein DinB
MPLSSKLREIAEKITSQRQAMLTQIEGLSDAQLNYTSGDGSWSISTIVHHLAITDEANAKFTSRILRGKDALPADGSPDTSLVTCLDEVGERLRHDRFTAPEFVTPHADSPISDSLARLEASRRRMLDNLDELSAYDLSSITHSHPFAGEMNAYQWFLMAGAHEARHTSQIKRLKRQESFPK